MTLSSLPEEVVEQILLRVDTSTTVLSCSLVCRRWSKIVQSCQFWRTKLQQLQKHLLPDHLLHNQTTTLSWTFFACLCDKNGYRRNLVVNCCGEEVGTKELEAQDKRQVVDGFTEPWPNYKAWNILSSGGSGWRCVKTPDGETDRFPDDLLEKSYFSSSYQSCTKEQTVSLCREGVLESVLDNYQPEIEVADNYNKYSGIGSVYELHVSLVDECENVVGKTFSFRDDMAPEAGTGWRRVSHRFVDYGVGARYVKFYHGGTTADNMEEGWRGAKMTGSSVVVDYPGQVKTNERFRCNCKVSHKNALIRAIKTAFTVN